MIYHLASRPYRLFSILDHAATGPLLHCCCSCKSEQSLLSHHNLGELTARPRAGESKPDDAMTLHHGQDVQNELEPLRWASTGIAPYSAATE